MTDAQYIKKFIGDLCNMLDIEEPLLRQATPDELNQISLTQNFFAELAGTKRSIVYRKPYSSLLTDDAAISYLFFICHEVRHLYQYDEIREPVIENLATVKSWEKELEETAHFEKIDVEQHNKLLTEIDAHAFAVFAMEELLNIKIDIKTLPCPPCEIIKRMAEIEKDFI